MRKFLFQGLLRSPLTESAPTPDDVAVAELAGALAKASRRRLGRSLSIREVDAGSCNGCELEIHALGNAFYDLERFGLRFVASPRHADVLLVTGPVTKNMREALERTYAATPDPKWVVAVGDCAFDGGRVRWRLRLRRGRQSSHPRRPPHTRLPARSDHPIARPHRARRTSNVTDQTWFLCPNRGTPIRTLFVPLVYKFSRNGTAGRRRPARFWKRAWIAFFEIVSACRATAWVTRDPTGSVFRYFFQCRRGDPEGDILSRFGSSGTGLKSVVERRGKCPPRPGRAG